MANVCLSFQLHHSAGGYVRRFLFCIFQTIMATAMCACRARSVTSTPVHIFNSLLSCTVLNTFFISFFIFCYVFFFTYLCLLVIRIGAQKYNCNALKVLNASIHRCLRICIHHTCYSYTRLDKSPTVQMVMSINKYCINRSLFCQITHNENANTSHTAAR